MEGKEEHPHWSGSKEPALLYGQGTAGISDRHPVGCIRIFATGTQTALSTQEADGRKD